MPFARANGAKTKQEPLKWTFSFGKAKTIDLQQPENRIKTKTLKWFV